MSIQTDVVNTHLNASGSIYDARTRVRGLVLTSTGAGAGSVKLRDGGSGGTILIEIDVPATAAFHSVTIPGDGVLFSTNVYATLANCYVSVFHG